MGDLEGPFWVLVVLAVIGVLALGVGAIAGLLWVVTHVRIVVM